MGWFDCMGHNQQLEVYKSGITADIIFGQNATLDNPISIAVTPQPGNKSFESYPTNTPEKTTPKDIHIF